MIKKNIQYLFSFLPDIYFKSRLIRERGIDGYLCGILQPSKIELSLLKRNFKLLSTTECTLPALGSINIERYQNQNFKLGNILLEANQKSEPPLITRHGNVRGG